MFETMIQNSDFRSLIASMKTAKAKYRDTGRLSSFEFAALLEIDPSPTKKYIDWLCESLIRNGGVTIDYAYSMPALIGQFHDMVENHLFPGVDINKVEPTVAALKNLIQTQEKKYMERAFNLSSLVKGKDYEEIESPSNFRIFRILTYKASKKLGSSTNWCIVPNEEKFNEHFGNSHIFFTINRDNFKDKYAVTINRNAPSRHGTVVTIPENRDMNLREFEEKTGIPIDFLVKHTNRGVISMILATRSLAALGRGYEEVQSPGDYRIFRILTQRGFKELESGNHWCLDQNKDEKWCLDQEKGNQWCIDKGKGNKWCIDNDKKSGVTPCCCCVSQDSSVFNQYFAVKHIYVMVSKSNPKNRFAALVDRRHPSRVGVDIYSKDNDPVDSHKFESETKIPVDYLVKVSE